jgi:predicted amidohydrolase
MRNARISILNTHEPGRAEDGATLLARAVKRTGLAGRDRPDLIVLSELLANHPKERTRAAAVDAAQTVPGPISEEFAALARRFHTYIAFGLLRRETGGERIYNSLVLLDREGRCAWTYDKVCPVDWEMQLCGTIPGGVPQAFACDFGRIGAAICFDINYNELAETYFRQDVELLLFSSAFPAGRLLDSWAVRFGFAVAGSTWCPQNRIIDCTGATVARTSDALPYATAVLNLNRRVVHMDYNMEKIERLRAKYAGDVLIEDMRDEATCVISSLKPGLEVGEIIREFAITPLPAYFDRSRRVRAEHGGWPMPGWH